LIARSEHLTAHRVALILVMLSANLDFLFYKELDDTQDCTRGQKDLALSWVKEHNLPTFANVSARHPSMAYWGALHLFRMSFWLSREVQDMLTMYADNGGVYRHRWCEQTTYPYVIDAHGGRAALMGGFSMTHAMDRAAWERWDDSSMCKQSASKY
jgi:hypothetical protein